MNDETIDIEEVTQPQKPIDLLLHDAIRENIELIDKLKPITDLILWIKFFMVFLGITVVLVLLKFFRFF